MPDVVSLSRNIWNASLLILQVQYRLSLLQGQYSAKLHIYFVYVSLNVEPADTLVTLRAMCNVQAASSLSLIDIWQLTTSTFMTKVVAVQHHDDLLNIDVIKVYIESLKLLTLLF